MKKIITLVTFFFAFGQMSFGQTMPTKSQAKKDLEIRIKSIEKQMIGYGAAEGMKEAKIEFSGGPYTEYSYSALRFGWNYVAKPDVAYYYFNITPPVLKNGDKYVFEVKVWYNSYEYNNDGYRTSLNGYKLDGVNSYISLYEGKDLTNSQLLNILNDLSKEKAKLFKADNFEFVKIDSIQFVKRDYTNPKNPGNKYYEVNIFGPGAEFMSLGLDNKDKIEYETKKTAYINGKYYLTVFKDGANWKSAGIREYFHNLKGKNSYTNESEEIVIPTYKRLGQVTLKDLMAGYTLEESIPKTTFRAINDIKRLITQRLNTEKREDFIRGDLLTKIFESDESKKVLDEMYVFKNTAKAYYFNTTNIGFNLKGNLFKTEGEEQVLSFNFFVVRRLSAEELKKIKTEEKPNKNVMKTIKIPVRGFFKAQFTVKLQNNEFVVTKSESSTDFKNYNDGRLMNHPLSEK